jgi:FAD/FMN-containing dehydrogenase
VNAPRVLRREEPGYEQARRAAVVNTRCPDRLPDAIIRARSQEDVLAAVMLARTRGWRIGVRSGGHSWAGSHLRDGGLLLDLSEMTGFTIDPERSTAIAEPGLRSSAFQTALNPHDLFFPTGHCIGPCLGGFLLQGGFGWNSRAVGPACMSVTGVDVVTAAGDLVHADEDHHADLFWAARGAGPGFCGVVTRFHLRLHRRPHVQMSSTYLYGPDQLEELMGWAHAVGPDVAPSIELMVFMRRDLMGHPGPALQVLAPVLAETEEQARSELAFLDQCPLRDVALQSETYRSTDVGELVAHSADFYPAGWRYAVDNMWTHAGAEQLVPGYRRILETLPQSPSHAMWMNWRPATGPVRPDMAYSLEDDVYLALYGVWEGEASDALFADWATERMSEMAPLASGIQLADENLGRRPGRFVSDEHLRRLDQVREQWDPSGVFHAWMGRPNDDVGVSSPRG